MISTRLKTAELEAPEQERGNRPVPVASGYEGNARKQTHKKRISEMCLPAEYRLSNFLPRLSVQYSTAQYSSVQYSTAQYSTVQHSTAQYSTVQYSTAQHSTAQYSTVPHIISRPVFYISSLIDYRQSRYNFYTTWSNVIADSSRIP
jgi:hypothetical protein